MMGLGADEFPPVLTMRFGPPVTKNSVLREGRASSPPDSSAVAENAEARKTAVQKKNARRKMLLTKIPCYL